jgi:hypothetical protein
LVAVAALALIYAWVLHKYSASGWRHFTPASTQEGSAETATKQAFLAGTAGDEQRYDTLFGYFSSGAIKYTVAPGSRIQFPGASSANGYSINGLEGFSRTGQLLAAWVASGRNPTIVDSASGKQEDLVSYLRQGLLAGTDPKSGGYWGKIRSWDERLVDSADVARIVWMTRTQIWQQLDRQQQAQIAAWLQQVDGLQMPDNIWLLFPVTVDVVLHSLGMSDATTLSNATSNYQKFKQNYLGNGWFNNPPEGVDFYNTWGINYELFWITLIDPQFDTEFIRSALKQSADVTAHLVGTDGIPMMGRSICYRTAVTVPLLTEDLLDDQAVSPGLARHAMDLVWRHFIAHGVLQDGSLTQGYYRTDLRFLDYYSGPGSCNWGLRSLALAYLHAPGSQFWVAKEQLLPVEQGDYRISYDKLGWIVTGRHDDGSVTIDIPRNAGKTPKTLAYGAWRGWLEHVVQRPLRPVNEDTEYNRPSYNSAKPFVSD